MFSNSVSSRSVLARRCSRETATLEGWRSGQGTAPARIFTGEEVIRIADLKAEDSRAAKLSPDEQREGRFALDSLLEGDGFEPLVPQREGMGLFETTLIGLWSLYLRGEATYLARGTWSLHPVCSSAESQKLEHRDPASGAMRGETLGSRQIGIS